MALHADIYLGRAFLRLLNLLKGARDLLHLFKIPEKSVDKDTMKCRMFLGIITE